MATVNTWIWVLVTIFAICVVALIATAGAGIYFVSHHIALQKTSSADALRTFDAARARFTAKEPLIDVDPFEHTHQLRPTTELPTSPVRPANLHVIAWNPDERRLARVTLPLWLLRIGKQKLDLVEEFDLQRLNLDIRELERIGPSLVLDYRSPSGERVLIWTQ